MESAAERLAALVGADADEIVFTSGATEANNLALLGIGRRAAGGVRRRILISAIEHKSVLATCRAPEARCGFKVELLPVDRQGILVLGALRDAIDSNVLLVSVMAVNNEIGTIQPVDEIAAIAREHGALDHCDAAQAPCAIDLSAIASKADLISLSAHKIYGPKGIGALALRRDLHDRIEPLIYGGGQQNGIRSGTVPVPLCVGMAAATELLRDAEKERDSVCALRDRFIRGLESAGAEFAINGAANERGHPGNLSVRFPEA